MKQWTDNNISGLSVEARRSVRNRAHLCMHQSESDAVQRLFVSMMPESYVRPHRHSRPGAWESFILLEGEALCLIFDDAGRVLTRTHLGKNDVCAIEIDPGAWHSLLSLSVKTLLLELKPGPYTPVSSVDWAPWSPAEGEDSCAQLLFWERMAHTGDMWK